MVFENEVVFWTPTKTKRLQATRERPLLWCDDIHQMMSEEPKRNEDGVELLKMVLITNTLHTYTTILFDVTFIAIATGNCFEYITYIS